MKCHRLCLLCDNNIIFNYNISVKMQREDNDRLFCRLLTFKAYRLRDAPTGLTFNNCTLCPRCSYVFCIYLRTNSDFCPIQNKLIGFYNREETFYSAIRTGSLNKAVCASSLKC
jgi:hypothetical protein